MRDPRTFQSGTAVLTSYRKRNVDQAAFNKTKELNRQVLLSRFRMIDVDSTAFGRFDC